MAAFQPGDEVYLLATKLLSSHKGSHKVGAGRGYDCVPYHARVLSLQARPESAAADSASAATSASASASAAASSDAQTYVVVAWSLPDYRWIQTGVSAVLLLPRGGSVAVPSDWHLRPSLAKALKDLPAPVYVDYVHVEKGKAVKVRATADALKAPAQEMREKLAAASIPVESLASLEPLGTDGDGNGDQSKGNGRGASVASRHVGPTPSDVDDGGGDTGSRRLPSAVVRGQQPVVSADVLSKAVAHNLITRMAQWLEQHRGPRDDPTDHLNREPPAALSSAHHHFFPTGSLPAGKTGRADMTKADWVEFWKTIMLESRGCGWPPELRGHYSAFAEEYRRRLQPPAAAGPQQQQQQHPRPSFGPPPPPSRKRMRTEDDPSTAASCEDPLRCPGPAAAGSAAGAGAGTGRCPTCASAPPRLAEPTSPTARIPPGAPPGLFGLPPMPPPGQATVPAPPGLFGPPVPPPGQASAVPPGLFGPPVQPPGHWRGSAVPPGLFGPSVLPPGQAPAATSALLGPNPGVRSGRVGVGTAAITSAGMVPIGSGLGRVGGSDVGGPGGLMGMFGGGPLVDTSTGATAADGRGPIGAGLGPGGVGTGTGALGLGFGGDVRTGGGGRLGGAGVGTGTGAPGFGVGVGMDSTGGPIGGGLDLEGGAGQLGADVPGDAAADGDPGADDAAVDGRLGLAADRRGGVGDDHRGAVPPSGLVYPGRDLGTGAGVPAGTGGGGGGGGGADGGIHGGTGGDGHRGGADNAARPREQGCCDDDYSDDLWSAYEQSLTPADRADATLIATLAAARRMYRPADWLMIDVVGSLTGPRRRGLLASRTMALPAHPLCPVGFVGVRVADIRDAVQQLPWTMDDEIVYRLFEVGKFDLHELHDPHKGHTSILAARPQHQYNKQNRGCQSIWAAATYRRQPRGCNFRLGRAFIVSHPGTAPERGAWLHVAVFHNIANNMIAAHTECSVSCVGQRGPVPAGLAFLHHGRVTNSGPLGETCCPYHAVSGGVPGLLRMLRAHFLRHPEDRALLRELVTGTEPLVSTPGGSSVAARARNRDGAPGADAVSADAAGDGAAADANDRRTPVRNRRGAAGAAATTTPSVTAAAGGSSAARGSGRGARGRGAPLPAPTTSSPQRQQRGAATSGGRGRGTGTAKANKGSTAAEILAAAVAKAEQDSDDDDDEDDESDEEEDDA